MARDLCIPNRHRNAKFNFEGDDKFSKGVSVCVGGKIKNLPLSEANIEKKAEKSWSSLAKIMIWLKSEVDRIVANETKTKSIS